jgi:hypothetical protein
VNRYYHRDSAVHELGHGLVAVARGSTGVVAHMPGDHGRGYCQHRGARRSTELDALCDELVVLLGGTAAEVIASGQNPIGDGERDATDFALWALEIETQPEPNALVYAEERLGRRTVHHMSAELLADAVLILGRRWSQLQRLRPELERKRTLRLN